MDTILYVSRLKSDSLPISFGASWDQTVEAVVNHNNRYPNDTYIPDYTIDTIRVKGEGSMNKEDLEKILQAIDILEGLDPRITVIYGARRDFSINLDCTIEEFNKARREMESASTNITKA